jgi:excisionase family DNA binding protein
MQSYTMHAGLTVKDVARRFRVSRDKVRRWIRSGELRAANTADPGERPRFVVGVDAIAEFEAARNAGRPTPQPQRRPRRLKVKDYYPSDN